MIIQIALGIVLGGILLAGLAWLIDRVGGLKNIFKLLALLITGIPILLLLVTISMEWILYNFNNKQSLGIPMWAWLLGLFTSFGFTLLGIYLSEKFTY